MDTPFFGPFDVSRSGNFADNQLINLYPEIAETRDGKRVGALFATPGLTLINEVGGLAAGTPIRALYTSTGPAIWLYVVAAQFVYVMGGPPSYPITFIGSIATAFGPVYFVDNGSQVLLMDGNAGYILNNTTNPPTMNSTPITLPFSSPYTGAYQDTFGFAFQIETNTLWQSNSGDLSTWNALNFAKADASGTPIVAIASLHREVWISKYYTIEVWVDAGLSGFSFQRLDGIYIEVGCMSQATLCKVDESLVFLARNQQGDTTIVMMRGYVPVRVSTHAVETAIQNYATVTDAYAYAHQQHGHTFYVITFPTGNETWVYDVTESALAGVPFWHKRQSTSGDRHLSSCAASFYGHTFVGDHTNPNIYILDPTNLTDNGTPRTWTRSWRAMQQPTMQPQRFSSLQIDMMTGQNVPAPNNPHVSLSWSDDGGHTWSTPLVESAGPSGATAQRVMFRRLGSTRRDTGLDRIFQLTSSDAFGTALMGAVLEV